MLLCQMIRSSLYKTYDIYPQWMFGIRVQHSFTLNNSSITGESVQG